MAPGRDSLEPEPKTRCLGRTPHSRPGAETVGQPVGSKTPKQLGPHSRPGCVRMSVRGFQSLGSRSPPPAPRPARSELPKTPKDGLWTSAQHVGPAAWLCPHLQLSSSPWE